MQRDMLKIVERNRENIPLQYDLCLDEMQTLEGMVDCGLKWNVIVLAYVYGFCMGSRATKAGKFKERKK